MRSMMAVLGGYIVALLMVVAFFVAFSLLYGPATPPSTVWMLGSLGWGLLSAIVAGWVTARLAPFEPRTHAAWLIGLSLTIGILFTWVFPAGSAETPAAEPLWLQIGNLLVVIVGVPIGTRLFIARSTPGAGVLPGS